MLSSFNTSEDIGIPEPTLKFLVQKSKEVLQEKRIVKYVVLFRDLFDKIGVLTKYRDS